MLPLYQLPPKPKAASTINLDFSPDQVGSWLAKLPISNPAEAAEKLGRFLSAFNRIELPASHRARLADLLKTSVYHLADKLVPGLDGQTLPLPKPQYRTLELGQTLLGELATTQKRLILDALSRSQDGATVGKLLSDLLDCTGRLTLSCYRNHTALPTGLWLDLHQSYLCAQHFGIAATPQGGDLVETYKAMLLLALADPYQFTGQELDWTRDLAVRTAGMANIAPANAAGKSLAPFHIQADMDNPPQPSTRHYTKAQSTLFFETSGIARQLAMLGNAIRTRRVKAGLTLPPEADWPAYSVLLNKLKLRWGASKHRMIQRRKPPHESAYEITLGWDNLSASPQAPTTKRALCSPINDSAGGLALKHEGEFPMPIEIGAVIGLRQAGSEKWHLGLVRWFKQPQADHLLFGLQLLGHKAEPVSVARPDGGKTGHGFLTYSTGGKLDCLILPAAMAPTAGAQLAVESAHGTQTVFLAQHLEGNADSAIFRVQLVAG